MTNLPYYDQLGGAAVLPDMVQSFYTRVLDDPDLRPYFTGADMPNLKRHMAILLASILGGPVAYKGRDLAEAHHDLKINERDYGKVGDILLGLMREHGVGKEVLDHVATTLGQVRPSIVTDPS